MPFPFLPPHPPSALLPQLAPASRATVHGEGGRGRGLPAQEEGAGHCLEGGGKRATTRAGPRTHHHSAR
eukprot:scaffold1035_cov374-Prasinococcus_capsulatus_cf.AAC.1